jgi:hypothetical protein
VGKQVVVVAESKAALYIGEEVACVVSGLVGKAGLQLFSCFRIFVGKQVVVVAESKAALYIGEEVACVVSGLVGKAGLQLSLRF